MTDSEIVFQYHDGTKHHFHRFARSLGYLDWALQPNPFRSFSGSSSFPLYPSPDAAGTRLAYEAVPVAYDQLFTGQKPSPVPLSSAAIGDLLRHALGLSAWKRFGQSRWSLRVNPSSGNLHPTEAYVVCPPLIGLADAPAVYHYAADRHALDVRCLMDGHAWEGACSSGLVLVALTSIHWRESWKYGERAFRYCQHDLGHAIAAVTLAAAMLGWRTLMLPTWSQRAIAAVTGVDRDEDFVDAEREEPGCVIAIAGDDDVELSCSAEHLVDRARAGTWSGRANQLSHDHVQWTFIDEVAGATEDYGRPAVPARPVLPAHPALPAHSLRAPDARAIALQRRSALAFDGHSSIDRDTFRRMLTRVMPAASAPWQAHWWTPRIHLALFVHRVDDVVPGIYFLARDAHALDTLRASFRSDFEWERADEALPLFRLAHGECRALARRLSCDQEIAADGNFSLGMVATFAASIAEHGPSFYRHLFWESGMVGQILYLEAEAAGIRSTGIGCFYDDPVHEVLGLTGHAFQSLYHFTVGTPVNDTRLTTEAGYSWET